ncbi:MAG: hypothetical protein ACRERU_17430 [Methylococcales bacterium]
MTLLLDFLTTLSQAITAPLHVEFDPQRSAANTNHILIGVGHWATREVPVEHLGVCLNNKGLA